MKLTVIGYDIEQDCTCSDHFELDPTDKDVAQKAAALLQKTRTCTFDCLWLVSAEQGVVGDYREGKHFESSPVEFDG